MLSLLPPTGCRRRRQGKPTAGQLPPSLAVRPMSHRPLVGLCLALLLPPSVLSFLPRQSIISMSSSTTPRDQEKVVICGGGIVGASIAYHLTLKGFKPTIIERAQVASAASGKAGGFLARYALCFDGGPGSYLCFDDDSDGILLWGLQGLGRWWCDPRAPPSVFRYAC